MSRLEAAKAWYDARLRALEAIDDWMRDRAEVPKVLRPIVEDFYDKKQGRERFKQERMDLQRVALIRIFSGFEADFRERLTIWLKTKLDTVHPAQSAMRKMDDIGAALPESIESCLKLFRALEPRFSGSDKGWLDNLRGFRNEAMHGGFPDSNIVVDPNDAYDRLKRILQYLEPIPTATHSSPING